MVQVPRRPELSTSAFIRLLARLADLDVAGPKKSLSDQLSLWLSWTDAIALSGALGARPAASQTGAHMASDGDDDECRRVRAALAHDITTDDLLTGSARPPRRGMRRVEPAAPVTDYASYRQRYAFRQQEMETAIRRLRSRLRVSMAARSPDMTRLAAVDAVMEQVVGSRERNLLAGVPGLLEGHFERLRRQDASHAESPPADGESAAGPWLAAFRKDMQQVLLAELELRLQPVEALLAALRVE